LEASALLAHNTGGHKDLLAEIKRFPNLNVAVFVDQAGFACDRLNAPNGTIEIFILNSWHGVALRSI
jgi:hypothetical protein